MLSRQEVNTMRHLANAQYWDRPAGGNTGRLFLAFGGPVCADRFSNCPLDRVLTYKNLIYLLNLQFYDPSLTHKGGPWGKTDRLFRLSTYGFLLPPNTFYGSKCNT